MLLESSRPYPRSILEKMNFKLMMMMNELSVIANIYLAVIIEFQFGLQTEAYLRIPLIATSSTLKFFEGYALLNFIERKWVYNNQV